MGINGEHKTLNTPEAQAEMYEHNLKLLKAADGLASLTGKIIGDGRDVIVGNNPFVFDSLPLLDALGVETKAEAIEILEGIQELVAKKASFENVLLSAVNRRLAVRTNVATPEGVRTTSIILEDGQKPTPDFYRGLQ